MSAETVSQTLAPIPVADAQIERLMLTGNEAVVELRDWRYQLWKLHFGEVVLFRAYEYCADLSEIRVIERNSAIEEALSVIERNGGNRQGYSGLVAVEFLDAVCGFPMVAIVCQQVAVTLLEVTPVKEGKS